MQLGFFIYLSETMLAPHSAAVRHLVAEAQQTNARHDLTGCLHHEDGLFCQWLEGPPAAVNHIGKKIEVDDRHFGVTFLDRGALDQRRFDSWSMRYSSAGRGSVLNWLARAPLVDGKPETRAASLLKFLQHRANSV